MDARLRRGAVRLPAAGGHAQPSRRCCGKRPNGNPEIVLNFITPHQKWGIHSTYTDNLLMLTLSRGGPIVWISETDAKKAGIEDNDWIELYNVNGAITARAVVSQRVNEGMCLMYHAQEKIVNVPGVGDHRHRGGIHNSVTRTVVKPTHMIGGYAQLALRLQLLRHGRLQPRRVRDRAQDGQGRLDGRPAESAQRPRIAVRKDEP